MKTPILLIIFYSQISASDIPLEVLNQLGGLHQVGVNEQEAFNIVKEESAKLGISFAQHYDNCLVSGNKEDYGTEIETFFTKVFPENSPFETKEQLLKVIEMQAPRLWSGKQRFDKMITKLDKESGTFVKDLYKRMLTIAVYVSQRFDNPMEYFPLVSRAIKKTTSSYKSLPQPSKDSLERVTCWYTLFRMMDKENPMKATWNLMRLLLAILLSLTCLSCEELLDKIRHIKDFEGNPVNIVTTMTVLQEESDKLGIALSKHYENCFEVKEGASKNEETITPEEIAKHRNEISAFMFAIFTDFNFDSTQEVLEEMEEYVPRLFARRSLIERTLGKLNKEAQMFLRNIWKEFLELIVKHTQGTREQKLDYMKTASGAIKKWSEDYILISQEAKNSLESITCAYTKLRIYDSKNTLAARFAGLEPIDDSFFHSEL
ncbi:hypothetical protein PRIPAC_80504 [Pristionchus pacificus]|uniref:Fatty-acid and retinol-binding protein 1 n=1 Tax=Pristionchus pacificus TaxID=54126 RepID=A0A2A6BXR2_PRIPA|nr:hypothetical protein PRIPAC_80504 [Pristionchus pacificus]|eukprot:PDM70792.1 hypothetical protein PRIPAC_44996 [Pristionchus pacificus]